MMALLCTEPTIEQSDNIPLVIWDEFTCMDLEMRGRLEPRCKLQDMGRI